MDGEILVKSEFLTIAQQSTIVQSLKNTNKNENNTCKLRVAKKLAFRFLLRVDDQLFSNETNLWSAETFKTSYTRKSAKKMKIKAETNTKALSN